MKTCNIINTIANTLSGDTNAKVFFTSKDGSGCISTADDMHALRDSLLKYQHADKLGEGVSVKGFPEEARGFNLYHLFGMSGKEYQWMYIAIKG